MFEKGSGSDRRGASDANTSPRCPASRIGCWTFIQFPPAETWILEGARQSQRGFYPPSTASSLPFSHRSLVLSDVTLWRVGTRDVCTLPYGARLGLLR